jgi:WD40 repeat protein
MLTDVLFLSSSSSSSPVVVRDVVTCLALASDGHTLVTGSKDSTLIVWNVQPPETKQQVLPHSCDNVHPS